MDVEFGIMIEAILFFGVVWGWCVGMVVIAYVGHYKNR